MIFFFFLQLGKVGEDKNGWENQKVEKNKDEKGKRIGESVLKRVVIETVAAFN